MFPFMFDGFLVQQDLLRYNNCPTTLQMTVGVDSESIVQFGNLQEVTYQVGV